MLQSQRTSWSVVLLAGLLVVLCVHQSYATRPAPVIQPAMIATIDIERVFNNIKVKEDEDRRLAGLADELQKQSDEAAEAINLLQEDLELYPRGSDKYQEALEAFSLKSLEYQATSEFSRRKIEVEKSLALKRIYIEIKAAARTMAEENGYHFVTIDDSRADLIAGTETEINRQISARKLLYATPQFDATDELIARMNNG